MENPRRPHDAEEYIFARSPDDAELLRLRKIEEEFDPATFGFLENLGMRPGLHCLEVGPGAGSVLRWMLEKTGPSGRVTAVDINPRFVSGIRDSRFDLIAGDAASVPLPAACFDIIHTRYVLMHIPDYSRAWFNLIQALRPGGAILLEEADFSLSGPGEKESPEGCAFDRVCRAIREMYRKMGIEDAMGGKLAGFLRDAAMQDVGTSLNAGWAWGGTGLALLMRDSVLHIKEKLTATGCCSAEDISAYAAYAADPGRRAAYYGTFSAWGRKPGH